MKKWKLIAQLKTGQIVKISSASLSEALEKIATMNSDWKKLTAKNF